MDRVCVQGLVSAYLVTLICGSRHGVREIKAKGNGYLVEQLLVGWFDFRNMDNWIACRSIGFRLPHWRQCIMKGFPVCNTAVRTRRSTRSDWLITCSGVIFEELIFSRQLRIFSFSKTRRFTYDRLRMRPLNSPYPEADEFTPCSPIISI
jgi:hypothetical protein